MVRFLWLRCRYKKERQSGEDLTCGRIDSQGDIRKSYRYWSRKLRASYYRSIKGKKVPEGVDMLAFYKQMLYGLLQTASLKRVFEKRAWK